MKMYAFDFISPFLQEYRMVRKIAGILPAGVLVAYMVVALLSSEGMILCFGKMGMWQ